MSDDSTPDKLPNGTLIAFLAVLTPLGAVVGIVIYIGALRAMWRRQGRWVGWRAFHAQQYGPSGSGSGRSPNGKGKGSDNILRPVIHEVWLDVNDIARDSHLLILESEEAPENKGNENSDKGGKPSLDLESQAIPTGDGETQKVGLVWNNILPISLTQATIAGQQTLLTRDVLTFIKLPSQANPIHLHHNYQDFEDLTTHLEVCLGVTSVQ